MNSHVNVDGYHRTFVNAVTKGDRTRDEEDDMVVGAERGDVERTREANNPNFIVGDLHSESHYQTTVPHTRYNYAGVVAQQKCIEFSLSLSFHHHFIPPLSNSLCLSVFALFLLSTFLFSFSVLTFFICTRFTPIICAGLYAYLPLSVLAHFAFLPIVYRLRDFLIII